MSAQPSLHELVAPATATARLRETGVNVAHAAPDYVRFKPGDTTLISYLLTTSEGSVQRGYVRWCNDSAEADAICRKSQTLRQTASPLGVGATRLDEHTIFYPFPNDARLRLLRWYITPRKWKRTLGPLVPYPMQLSGSRSSVEVLRYKPERRVVAAGHLVTTNGHRRSVLIRYATSQQATPMARLAVALRRAGIDTPEPLLQLDDGRVSVDAFVDATDLSAEVAASCAPCSDVASAIAMFHGANLAAPCRSTAGELADTSRGLEGLACWHEPAREASDRLRQRLQETVPESSPHHVLLHGDLHDRNMMIRPSGGVVFVDLERVARGPAAIDLGLFRAAARAATIRRPDLSAHAVEFADETIERYRSRNSHHVSGHELAWHGATALAGQALLAARHLEPNWEERVALLLDTAIAEVGG